MAVRMRPLLVGTATYIPGFRKLTARRTGGSVSARYCYSVWLRHLAMLGANGLPTDPAVVAELGPGDSLGLGMAALLSGAGRYIALDVVRYADNARNLEIFDDLIALFRARVPIPDAAEFPLVRPLLPSYDFPHAILTYERLAAALDPSRLAALRAAVQAPAPDPRADTPVCYVVPWDEAAIVAPGTVDLILSQAVLEYPRDLPGTYAAMCRWLKPGGVMSHDIDFKSHGTMVEWNGHWSCSDALWRLVEGRRRDVLNREPHSAHLALLHANNCLITCDARNVQPSGIPRARLSPRFRHLTDDDLTTSSAFIQAVKIS